MVKTISASEQGVTLPYGPTRGMLQALQLMRKTTPQKVDGSFLRLNKIAPGNEYKVVGALRFLGIIDDECIPTEKSRLLKTKGAAFAAALQGIVRSAYTNLFQHIGSNGCHSQEDIYNYFITEEGLGPEMSSKTTRFFVQLCQLAEIDLGFNGRGKTPANFTKAANGHNKNGMGQSPQNGSSAMIQVGALSNFPIVLAITPAMASMDTDELTEFLRKLKTALTKVSEE